MLTTVAVYNIILSRALDAELAKLICYKMRKLIPRPTQSAQTQDQPVYVSSLLGEWTVLFQSC